MAISDPRDVVRHCAMAHRKQLDALAEALVAREACDEQKFLKLCVVTCQILTRSENEIFV